MRLLHDVTDRLEERVEEIAESLASRSLLSQVAMKELIASDTIEDERFEHWMRLVRDSGEAEEGAKAFLERRAPEFPWKPQRAQREER